MENQTKTVSKTTQHEQLLEKKRIYKQWEKQQK